MARIPVIDADAHVVEPMQELRKLMPAEYQDRPLTEGETWDRNLNGTRGKRNHDPAVQIADMDAEGIDVQVIYPTSQISLSHVKETGLALERARTYNDWLAGFCANDPKRLKGVGVVALQDVD